MADLRELLRDAREKSAAEASAAEVRASLLKLDTESRELKLIQDQLERRVSKSKGLFARFRGTPGQMVEDEARLAQVEAAIGDKKLQIKNGQKYLRSLIDDAYGVELARARVGAELKERTASLGRHDPARGRLNEIELQRESLTSSRALAKSVSSLAGELLTWVDGAERLDDGTDVLYVSLIGASQKYEELQDVLQPNALYVRTMLKDRLEGFRTFPDAEQSYRSLGDIASLVVEDYGSDHQWWLRRVREALTKALEEAVQHEKAVRKQLVEIDEERVTLLSN